MRGFAAFCLLLIAPAAPAQQAGDTVVRVGWIHIAPGHEQLALHTDLRPSLAGSALGIPDSFDSPGVGASVDPVDAVGISISRFIADRWSLTLNAGIPPIVEVSGRGVAQPPGPAGPLFAVDLGDPDFNPLGSARQWSPALALDYHFFSPGARIRPFVGAGFTFTWFTQEALNPAFEDELNNRVGQQLALAAGKPGPTSVTVRADNVWAPVLAVGLPVALNAQWGLLLSAGYIPFHTRSRVEIVAQDGTVLATSRPRLDVDALVTGLLLSYRF